MHELSLAQSILEIVSTELQSRPGAKAVAVGVRIGALAAVDPESLRFGFEASTKGTDLECLKLDIHITETERQCLMCDHHFKLAGLDAACPECGSRDSIPMGGDELDIEYLEVEDGKN